MTEFWELYCRVVREVAARVESDRVSYVLVGFLVRVGNTFKSICTLQEHCLGDGFLNDGGALLRVMLDAGIQAEYIYHDPFERIARAQLYLNYQFIERHNVERRWIATNEALARALPEDPQRAAGLQQLEDHYNVVAWQYTGESGRVRNKWHAQTLPQMAVAIGRGAIHEALLTSLQECVHSGSRCVHDGPLGIKAEFIVPWAAALANQVLKINVAYHGLTLNEAETAIVAGMTQILDTMGPSSAELGATPQVEPQLGGQEA